MATKRIGSSGVSVDRPCKHPLDAAGAGRLCRFAKQKAQLGVRLVLGTTQAEAVAAAEALVTRPGLAAKRLHSGSDALFAFSGNQIRTAEVFDYDLKAQYHQRVRTTGSFREHHPGWGFAGVVGLWES